MFSLLLHLTGIYALGWMVCAIPAFLVGINLLRQSVADVAAVSPEPGLRS